MKKVISFFVIVVCLFFTIQLTSCSDKTDSPEVPEIPENPENPRDEAYYDSYIETVENLASQLNNGTITTNGQLIEFAKNYDNFKSVTEQDGVVYLEFDGGWTYFVDFDGRTAVSPIAEEDIDFSEFDELLSDLEEFDNVEPEDDSRSDVQESRATTNSKYLPSKFKVLYWGPFDNGADASNCYGEICNRLKYNIGTAYESVIDYDAIYGDQCSISDFSKFGDYDLVIFHTHGCKGGMPLVPNTMKGISSLSDRLPEGWVQNIECTALDYNLLSKKLPALGNTVVWTLMCYSFCENSTLASVAKLKAAGDYFGATEPINGLINFKLFVPFIARLYRGASSAEAFHPGGSQGYEYTFADDGEQVKGVYGHTGFDGVCFPLTGADKAVDNSPVATFQAPSGELDKVLKGNGSFKAGIEVKNTSTSKITKIELTSDNISASSHKDWEQIIDRNKYTFKTKELEDGIYEYRSYIEFPNGVIKYSENSETFRKCNKIYDDYFELYCDNDLSTETRIRISNYSENINIEHVLCDDEDYYSYYNDNSSVRSSIVVNIKPGLHHYKFYLNREPNHIYCSGSKICGGYIPFKGSLTISGNKIQKLSTTETGDYILTLPYIQEIDADIHSSQSVNLSGCVNLTKFSVYSSSLQSVNLSGCTNLSDIGGAFSRCTALQSIDLSSCVNLSVIGGAFKDCTALQSIDLSSCANLSHIGESAFKDCTALQSIDLSSCANLSHIGERAFKDCTALQSVNLSGCANLSEISVGAFLRCYSLQSVNLSGCANLSEISVIAFSRCYSLQSIDLSSCSNLSDIGSGAFSDCESLQSVNLSGCTNLSDIGGAFSDCTSLQSVNLSGCANLSDIGGAFSRCTALQSIDLSSCVNLSVIGGAFKDCTALQSIDLSSCANLSHIGERAFYSCTSLQSVNLSGCSNLSDIGDYTFSNCTSLQSIDLSSCINLKRIGVGAFADSKISKIVIPEKVNSICGYCFDGCPIETAYLYPTTPPATFPDNNPFPHSESNYAKIYVPASSVDTYKRRWGIWKKDDDGNRIYLNIFPM